MATVNGYRHERRPSRCTCPDCTTDYATHNRDVHCACQQCVEFREVGAPPPATNYLPTTRPDYYGFTAEEEYQRERDARIRRVEGAIREAEGKKKVSSLNMCERKECNAIIRGNAVGLADILTNNSHSGQRKGWELCPECIAEVDALLHTPPTGKREKAYDKPYGGWEEAQESATQQPEDIQHATAEQLVAALFEKMMREVNSGQRAISSLPKTRVYDEDETEA